MTPSFPFISFPLTFALEDIAAPPLGRVSPAVVAPSSSPGSPGTAPGALLQICTEEEEEEKKFYNPLSIFSFWEAHLGHLQSLAAAPRAGPPVGPLAPAAATAAAAAAVMLLLLLPLGAAEGRQDPLLRLLAELHSGGWAGR